MKTRPLSEDLMQIAKKELNEDYNRNKSDIDIIKQWLKKQPHLSQVKISDQRILSFLRGCKFSLERTKEKIDMYYTMKNLAPELFINRDPKDPIIQDILKLGVTLPLLELSDPIAPRVYMVRLGAYDPSKHSLYNVLKVSFMITDILLQEDDNFVVCGQDLLLDMKGVSFNMIAQFTPGLAKKVTTCTEKIFPIRQKANHMIHTPPGFEMGFNLFKSLLSEKNKSRIHVHNLDMDSLYKYVPQNIVPGELGGSGKNIEELIAYWKLKVESYRDWFIEEDKYKSIEKLRPEKPITSEEMFGMGVEGSFRKLNLD